MKGNDKNEEVRARRKATAVILAAFILSTAAEAGARDDWEYWASYTFNYKVNEKLTLKFIPNHRHKDDFQNPFYWESDQGFSYKLHKNVDVAAYYVYVEEDRPDTNLKENRYTSDLILKLPWKDWQFSDRNRYEYRTFNMGDSKGRYRNMFQVTFSPLEIAGQKITPYVSNEIFYDLKINEYNQNRAILGFTKKLTDKLKAGLYYMTKSVKSSGAWEESHIIGAKFDIDFN